MQTTITEYITELNRLYRVGHATEHTYRPALQRLLENLTSGLTVTNEPRRIACGAPDYIITRDKIPVGYIEAKDIGENLNDKKHKEQFHRYKQSLDNLIITDYLTFKLFENSKPIASVTIAQVTQNGIEAEKSAFDALIELVNRFAGYHGQGICSSEHLSKIMAAKSRLMAKIIENALNRDEKGDHLSLDGQLKGFREILIHDIGHKEFSDVYAQTIAYGMFAARLHDKTSESFTRGKAAQLIPPSNPFLRKLFKYIADFELDERIRWVVDDLADLFNYMDIHAVKEEFGKAQHDPMIHFYETFLAEYDPGLRKSRGVWYTPSPAVKFIVQAVDDILKQDFKLREGLADASKTENDFHRVQILDPATGTGTFLVEVVQNIYRRYKRQQGLWQSYVADHLIPRINGFEILMAPYSMAHLKLEMVLQQTGYQHSNNGRLRIYLTNSLDKARPKTEMLSFAKWLSDEANEAGHIKNDVPVMVVMGNPPYNVSTQNKNDWIEGLIADYKQGLNERNIQPLSDDYIKFIRYGQHLIEKNGSGVLAYISNNSFINGLIHRQMRKHLLEIFDTIYILDLHGDSNKKETAPDGSKDENVFDIKKGVSINIFVKTGRKAKKALAKVFQFDLYGKQRDKYNFLLNNSRNTIQWRKLELAEPQYFFVPKDFTLQKEYENGFKVDELFPINSSGVKTHDDTNLVSYSPFADNNQQYDYRPFDTRYIDYDLKKVLRHRHGVMKYFIKGKNLGLVVARQGISDKWSNIQVTKNIIDNRIHYTYGTAISCPLYLYPDQSTLLNAPRIPNLDPKIVNEIAERLNLQFTVEKGSSKKTFAPIDILDYIYAVLHSPAYREQYKEFLKIDFPRVPYPDDAKTFWKLVKQGGKLRQLHLMEGVEPLSNMANFPVAGTNEVEKPQYMPGAKGGRVYINAEQYFDHVPSEAWEFYIGGYQPAQKWLKDRKGRQLNYDDIRHYRQIIRVLKETGQIILEIDEVMG